ncbi:MAG: hypothetical protein M1830_010261 [Pleopsidium flavum]|nr:MAG: hypothetical protein M1830_010261 [Pleopsidium flavum]
MAAILGSVTAIATPETGTNGVQIVAVGSGDNMFFGEPETTAYARSATGAAMPPTAAISAVVVAPSELAVKTPKPKNVNAIRRRFGDTHDVSDRQSRRRLNSFAGRALVQ